MAKAFLPQSPHDVIAIPLMNSPIATDIECLQFGHLYCWIDFISATRHYHASVHFPDIRQVLSLVHFRMQG
jgi:hypothetical protein